MTKILYNAVKCKKCGDVIVSPSFSKHVVCKCGCTAVDGGLDFIRREYNGVSPDDAYEELSIIDSTLSGKETSYDANSSM